jgi:hypothetical protein
MSTLRNPANVLKLRAHRLLDEVRAGIAHDARAVAWALAILGEPVQS